MDIRTQDWIVYIVVSLTAVRLFFPLLSVVRDFIGKPSDNDEDDFGCYNGACKSCDAAVTSKKNDPVLH
ncbi:hypothetical protein LEP1GSC194_4197 [Leptospira alstonii serovar Sichuan str. 79601]|uniref:Uncharacterized protein n=1 Tax=Leptospira alstonii serovar Sichuan str. 79601 TaxID=1218565 RepID=M6D1R9_9LEPT|nr:hypothetical protein LEP1GSC194_4197 [Leptospira alstonii serovar Sichuan str. 79601]